MQEPTVTFKRLGVTKGEDGLIKLFHLEATETRSDTTRRVSVTPRQITSARTMKTFLLGKGMFYLATRDQHDQMLLELTSSPDLEETTIA
ncbi:hypothetical protein NJC38_21905 [Pseudomonas sp. 21LCFQ010]|uniref:hypothetical protein n=1 Tax=Pseudomonas sp. 21LCFQ010 TaxID=2957506 RepID=UPI0020968399|nr:hypothetical protein [Pseudomonas sp. 21LCFQ010]MCO8164796.1 hypothetical protein [Pseudomonas sp. 21LCFQ010]